MTNASPPPAILGIATKLLEAIRAVLTAEEVYAAIMFIIFDAVEDEPASFYSR